MIRETPDSLRIGTAVRFLIAEAERLGLTFTVSRVPRPDTPLAQGNFILNIDITTINGTPAREEEWNHGR